MVRAPHRVWACGIEKRESDGGTGRVPKTGVPVSQWHTAQEAAEPRGLQKT